jgi:hypothetical protein
MLTGSELARSARSQPVADTARRAHQPRVTRRADDLWEALCWCKWSASGETLADVREAASAHSRRENAKASKAPKPTPSKPAKATKSEKPTKSAASRRRANPVRFDQSSPAVAPIQSRAPVSSRRAPLRAAEQHRVLDVARGARGWEAKCNNCSWTFGPVSKVDEVQAAARRHQASASAPKQESDGSASTHRMATTNRRSPTENRKAGPSRVARPDSV